MLDNGSAVSGSGRQQSAISRQGSAFSKKTTLREFVAACRLLIAEGWSHLLRPSHHPHLRQNLGTIDIDPSAQAFIIRRRLMGEQL